MAVLMLAVRLTFSLTLMGLLVSAGKKCSFNGKKFALDDVAYQMPENCAELKCVMEGKKARLTMTQMEGCSIVETSNKCTFNGKIVPVDDVAYQMTENCAELKCVMEGNHAFLILKQIEGCSIVDPEPTTSIPVIITPEASNTCTFNGKNIAVDDVAYQMTDTCEELKCVMEGNKTLLIMKQMEGCSIVDMSNKCTFNGKDIEVDDVAYQITENCEELKCVLEGKKPLLIMKPMEGCSIMETSNTCIFNGKNIAVDDVAYQITKNCEELKCVMEGNKPLLIMKQMEGCSIVVPNLPQTSSSTHKCNYKQFGKQHSMNLKSNEKCEFHKSGVTEEEKQIILKTHNDLRTKIARGQEKQGTPGPQPKAANMRELVWNDQLAEVAQAWAEQCPKWHDLYKNRKICNSTYRNTGQNIFANFGHTDQHLWEKAIQSWYGEVKFMPKTYVGAYQSPATGGEIGHFTQIVWAKTYEVGCGAIYYTAEVNGVKYKNSKKYICNYGPAGNMPNAAIYQKGRTASKCYLKNGKSKNFPFLCA